MSVLSEWLQHTNLASLLLLIVNAALCHQDQVPLISCPDLEVQALALAVSTFKVHQARDECPAADSDTAVRSLAHSQVYWLSNRTSSGIHSTMACSIRSPCPELHGQADCR